MRGEMLHLHQTASHYCAGCERHRGEAPFLPPSRVHVYSAFHPGAQRVLLPCHCQRCHTGPPLILDLSDNVLETPRGGSLCVDSRERVRPWTCGSRRTVTGGGALHTWARSAVAPCWLPGGLSPGVSRTLSSLGFGRRTGGTTWCTPDLRSPP